MIETLLHPLLVSAEALVPGMVGRLADPAGDDLRPGGDNRPAVRRLVAAIAAATPEAGRGYWAVRAWSMLTWQPAVLAVLGVHRFALVPPVDALGQTVKGGAVYGYTLPPDRVMRSGVETDLIACAGRRVRRIADGLLDDLNHEVRMKPVVARRLLADRVLGTLARPGLPQPPGLAQTAEQWLAALDLAGESGLTDLPLADGGSRLVLDRKACCLAYRVDGGILCSSCPKLAPDERQARLRADWETACV